MKPGGPEILPLPQFSADRRESRGGGWISPLQVSRPGFWITSAWFYLLPLSQRPIFSEWTFWLGLFYVTFPLGLLIYGWNDLADKNTDQFNPRKGTFLFGARLSPDQLRLLPGFIAAVHAPCLALFAALAGSAMLVWYAALLLATAIYNLPVYGFKNHPFVDLLNQAGYLLVFILGSRLNHVPELPWAAFLFGALFAMHSHLLGQIMDIAPDRLAGRRTTAILLGPVPAKLLLALFLLVESALVFFLFGDPLISGGCFFGALWFLFDALALFRGGPYPAWLMRWFLLGWNIAALGSMGWVWKNGTFLHARPWP